jgi:hypothetical protein
VRVLILAGERERALERLQPLLETDYFLSSGWLQIDPTFDPLRNHPDFIRLVSDRTTVRRTRGPHRGSRVGRRRPAAHDIIQS